MEILKKKKFTQLCNEQRIRDWCISILNCGRLGFSGPSGYYFVEEQHGDYIEQISDNDFLVVDKLNGKNSLTRVRFENRNTELLYKQVYDVCYELSSDLLLFETIDFDCDLMDVNTSYSIYSKKENKNLAKFDWLEGKYVIVPVIMDDERIGLYVANRIETDYGYDFVKFTVDIETFEPVRDVSVCDTFSDRKIDVSTIEDIKNIINETTKEKQMADYYLAKLGGQISEDSEGKTIQKKRINF